MSDARGYPPGGDAQAITRIANEHYGGFEKLFEARGWPERGARMMPAVQRRVAEAYGSVRAFERAHASQLMPPLDAINADPPNVWLTSFYGFDPDAWGFVGFTHERARRKFVGESEPGVLMVVYGTSKALPAERRKVLGLLQCSHQLGTAEEFMHPTEWRDKVADPDRADKWNHAVRVVRAWRVTPETRMDVEEFAPQSTAAGAWRHIGAQGVRLERDEAGRLLHLDLSEVDVFGQNPIVGASVAAAPEILSPSKAGPVSQTPFTTRESEGPKHLYVLRLIGSADDFLGRSAGGKFIVKAGFSKSPMTRCDDHNRALPRGAFRWEVLHSGAALGYDAHPSSDHAKAGERAMQEVLCGGPRGESLGGEFFLAEPALIDMAWDTGNAAARRFRR
ncbi:hypothetical protein [Minwuia thermotolerans]|uniref:Uncharacterized protein n=1 Tax=Minwuia thermotolerans TaxID=2056226 RepID=A0A2M9G6K0_9PROT|nr:hypothetical protein [Minwuia thermotolerans]PJK31337.1 hypothetical protein CVT23_01250 [Minwuia thermotolerans]